MLQLSPAVTCTAGPSRLATADTFNKTIGDLEANMATKADIQELKGDVSCCRYLAL